MFEIWLGDSTKLELDEDQEVAKWCTLCRRILPKGNFNKDKSNRDGLEHRCRSCRNEYKRSFWAKPEVRDRWIKKSKEFRKTHEGQRSRRRSAWKSRYNLSEDVYYQMCKTQNYSCAVCGIRVTGNDHLHVDHDHASGKVRGLLCRCCNTAVGMVRESREILKNLIVYLEQRK
jgi:hypothetical protein